MAPELEACMRVAIEEARRSLREGHEGFGAVILKNDEILAQAHDTGAADQKPTAHAERRAIRQASSLAGNLSGCLLFCTHEPCPACAEAITEARISRIIFGYGTADRRFGGLDVRVEGGLLRQECAVLYNQEVRAEVKRLRGATDERLQECGQQLIRRRLEWYRSAKDHLCLGTGEAAELGYRLLLSKLGVSEAEAPVVHRQKGRVVFHSRNFCPTLEACSILGLDTRRVCRTYNEEATEQLIRQLDSRLRFRRNYEKIRPHSEYCEERIEVEEH